MILDTCFFVYQNKKRVSFHSKKLLGSDRLPSHDVMATKLAIYLLGLNKHTLHLSNLCPPETKGITALSDTTGHRMVDQNRSIYLGAQELLEMNKLKCWLNLTE